MQQQQQQGGDPRDWGGAVRAAWVLARPASGGGAALVCSRRFATVEARVRRSAPPSTYVPCPTDDALVAAVRKHGGPARSAAAFDPLGGVLLALGGDEEEEADQEEAGEGRDEADGASVRAAWPLLALASPSGAFCVLALAAAPEALAARVARGAPNSAAARALELESLDQSVGTVLEVLEAAALEADAAHAAGGGDDAVAAHVRAFFAAALPYGTPVETLDGAWDLVRRSGAPPDAAPPPGAECQPYWKPTLHRGRQKLQFVVRERVDRATHAGREPLASSVGVEVWCRAELEGLPDVTVELVAPPGTVLGQLATHPCAQASEGSNAARASVCFSPPHGMFLLARLTPTPPPDAPPPPNPLHLTYSCRDTAEDAVEFTARIDLAKGTVAAADACVVTLPFPGRGPVSALRAQPSVGTLTSVTTPAGLPAVLWHLGPRFGVRGGSTATVTGSATFGAAPASSPQWTPFGEAAVPDSQGAARVAFRLPGTSLLGVKADARGVAVHEPSKGAVAVEARVSTECASGNVVAYNAAAPPPADPLV